MKATVKLMAMATVMVALASCSSDSVYNPNAVVEQKEAQYEKKFVQQFGKIDPKNDWGFGMATTKAETRLDFLKEGMKDYVNSTDLPANITSTEIETVKNALANKTYQIVDNLNLTNYYVQHVYASKREYEYEEKIYDENGTYLRTDKKKVTGSNQMDGLCANGEAFNDFNSASNGSQTITVEFIEGKDANNQDIRNYVSTDARLVLNSSTTSFSYHESFSNGGSMQSKYIIVEIGGAYYVCFDYTNDVYKGSDSYDDWVIKITAAHLKTDPEPAGITYERRIMCEDLGTTDDFDYNDVVFDVHLENGTAYIRLQAAGGTLPLYIGDTDHEVHALFGVSTGTMVNTGAGVTKDPFEFTLNGITSYSGISINVVNGESSYELTAEKGKAPKKICAASLIDWPTERQNIGKLYPKFSDWVTNADEKWYEE